MLRSLLITDNPPSPGKVGHTKGVYVSYSLRTVVWVLLSPTRTRHVKVLWDRTYNFCPYVITKAALSSQLFYDPGYRSCRGLIL